MKKKLVAFVLISIFLVYTFLIYDTLSQETVSMVDESVEVESVEFIEYSATPVFAENLRFNHNNISYRIDSSCSESQIESMTDAFDIFAETMEIISFYEVAEDADIEVGCSDEFILVSEQLFAAGEGGPSVIINTSYFKTIEQGKIILYDEEDCDYPVVEIHELLHVFGFDHTDNPDSLMYPISSCDQRITDDMIELIKELYSITPLAEARISELNATLTGKYLGFNITILNEGLLDIDDINLTIVGDGKVEQTINLGEIGIGYGRKLEVKNIQLSSKNIEEVVFYLDYENSVDELIEDNNNRTLTVS